MTNEDLDMILNAGLEKVAYEEGLNDYADSLEKVAGVHGVDAVDLHDFLEKAAADEVEDPKWKKWGRRGAGLGAGLGGGIAALGSGLHGFKRKDGPGIKNILGNSAIAGTAGGVNGGILGGLLGAGAGALQPKKKKKEASADDTLNYLFEKGLEALTE